MKKQTLTLLKDRLETLKVVIEHMVFGHSQYRESSLSMFHSEYHGVKKAIEWIESLPDDEEENNA